jgi:hypothetical protein
LGKGKRDQVPPVKIRKLVCFGDEMGERLKKFQAREGREEKREVIIKEKGEKKEKSFCWVRKTLENFSLT